MYFIQIEEKFSLRSNCKILDKKFFLNNYKNFRTKNHFEHVTSYFYEKKKIKFIISK